jgi:predicted CXXCH cytochrome family protein
MKLPQIKGCTTLCYVLYCVLLTPLIALAGVGNTKHNLSVSGPGTIKALGETQVCIFCHTPHNANPVVPLWNHEITSAQNYINYSSPTLQSYATQAEAPSIDGVSRLCLSCHDGTVALGAVIRSRDGEIEMTSKTMPPTAPGYLGLNLEGIHPISIVFDEALKNQRNSVTGLLPLKWPQRKYGEKGPIGDPDVKIYPTQGDYGVQCSSCHDPHGGKGAPGAPPFWRKETFDDVCMVCHDL